MTDLAEMPPARRIALSGGGWLHVHEQAGRKPTMLLLHGFTDCAQSYRLLLPHLAGRHIVIPDLRGHGQSFRASISSLDDFCADIEAMADGLRVGPVTLVGHSMGALIALRLAARGRLPVATLVTLSGSLAPASPTLAKVARQFAGLPHPLPVDHPFLDDWYACRRPVPPAFLRPLRTGCAAMRREDWAACLALLQRVDLRMEARKLAARALVIGGADDPLFPESHQIDLASTLPRAIRLSLSGVGHNPHWENAHEVAGELMLFEQGVEPIGGHPVPVSVGKDGLADS